MLESLSLKIRFLCGNCTVGADKKGQVSLELSIPFTSPLYIQSASVADLKITLPKMHVLRNENCMQEMAGFHPFVIVHLHLF